ncbi:hypothetical protein HLB23_40365 [Nocardia uniformis]|uniref:Uncharacterized protein n=1 Tax=Nocardia uniformis TaxID=53432 RepID=A0A849CBM5_9NOCA|nr:hypothetical protein [Nocardia uniformis]
MFTVDETSVFSTGVKELLRAARVRLVEWEQVRERAFRYDLVLAASENIDFDAIDAHTVLLPHGLGFNKLLPNGVGPDLRVAGLPPQHALRAGKVTVTLSHPEQRDQLFAVSPAIAGRTETVGDPTFDRLRASRGLRARYREAFGTGDRTLVAIASTWGRQSVIGRWQTLPAQLLGVLETDLYQLVAVLHPNVWAYYGEFQIKLWLSSALDAGLILMPPDSGWHAALIAADQVITDHGSLGLFAAALDQPLLMTGRAAETVPGTPTDELARCVPTLHPGGELRSQLDAARRLHVAGRYTHITDRVFTHSGSAAHNVQALIYRELALSPLPDPSPLTRIPIPECHTRAVTSYVVHTTTVATDASVTLVRFPAAVWRPADDVDDETHVVAEESEADLKIIERAAALTREIVLDTVPARQWACSALNDYPGARLAVAATTTGCLAVIRDGTVIRAVAEPADPVHTQLIASAIYCCLIDRSLPDRPLTIRAGTTTIDVTFTPDR